MGKTKKQAVSLFGIDDCHLPKKSYAPFKNAKTMKRRNKPFDYKTIILFPHNLGQTKTGVEKAPFYLNKYCVFPYHNINPNILSLLAILRN